MLQNFESLVLVWLALGFLTFITLLKIPAPYGKFSKTNGFEGLDRYRLHDVEVMLVKWNNIPSLATIRKYLKLALQLGNGRCLLATEQGDTNIWYSTSRVDSVSVPFANFKAEDFCTIASLTAW